MRGMRARAVHSRLASFIFGGSCFVCRGAARELLCDACDAELPRLTAPACPRCALASPGGLVCGRCLRDVPAYDATRAPLAYEFPADALIQALKFRDDLERLSADRAGRSEDEEAACHDPSVAAADKGRVRRCSRA